MAKPIKKIDDDYFDQLVVFEGEDFKGREVDGYVLHSTKRIDDRKHFEYIKIGNVLNDDIIEHYKNLLKEEYKQYNTKEEKNISIYHLADTFHVFNNIKLDDVLTQGIFDKHKMLEQMKNIIEKQLEENY